MIIIVDLCRFIRLVIVLLLLEVKMNIYFFAFRGIMVVKPVSICNADVTGKWADNLRL